jgi:hypothetical protein
MSYSTSAPPRLLCQSIGGGGSIWLYVSADAIATVNTAAYISNGAALGMAVGDTVIVRDSNVPTTSLCTVISVTAGSSCDLSDGTAVTQTNSD